MSIPELVVQLDLIPVEGLELALNIDPVALANLVTAPGQETPDIRSNLTGRLKLTLQAQRLLLSGEFQVDAVVTCDRCLLEFVTTLTGQINEALNLEPGENLADDQDDGPDGHLEIQGGRADLSELMAEIFWLAWPYRFICRPDCAGLCLHCGADLNEAPCGCAPTKYN